jgi:hypothetical protein
MAIIPVGAGEATSRITLVGDPEEMAVVWGFVIDVPPFDQGDADAVSNLIATFLTSQMGTGYRYEGSLFRIGQDGDPLLFSSTTGNGSGTQSATTVPQNTALLFHKRSPFGGRRNRGRMYVPGLGESAVDNAGVVLAAAVTAANTAADTLITGLNSAGFPMVILHESAPLTPTEVASFTVSTRAASQRRRLRS